MGVCENKTDGKTVKNCIVQKRKSYNVTNLPKNIVTLC